MMTVNSERDTIIKILIYIVYITANGSARMLLTLIAIALLLLLPLRWLLLLTLQEQQHRRQLHGLAPNVSQVPLVGAIWQMRHFQPDSK